MDGEYDYYGDFAASSHKIQATIDHEGGTHDASSRVGSLTNFSYDRDAGPVPGFTRGDWRTTTHTMLALPSKSYHDFNGYHPDEIVDVNWTCSAIVNNICCIGNVAIMQGGSVISRHNDLVLESQPSKYDTFPTGNWLEAGNTDDGDEIIQLESYENVLVIFKRNSVTGVEFGGGILRTLKFQVVDNGIWNPNAMVKTTEGIAWINDYSLFYFDGENVINLIEKSVTVAENQYTLKRITNESWLSQLGDDKDNAYITFNAVANQLSIQSTTKGT